MSWKITFYTKPDGDEGEARVIGRLPAHVDKGRTNDHPILCTQFEQRVSAAEVEDFKNSLNITNRGRDDLRDVLAVLRYTREPVYSMVEF
jgi:hypothetical protein